MASPQASEILGKINAIDTLIENFPSSLLDLLHGPQYDSVVDFLIDVLEACGVDIHEIIRELLSDVFDFKDQIASGITGVYESIENLEINDENKFFNFLEYSVKGILMTLLSSIFSCSALPILPNKYFDVGSNNPLFTPEMRSAIYAMEKLKFPVESIDPFGYLGVSPLSKEGRLYYKIEGKDVCYEKKQRIESYTVNQGTPVRHCVGAPVPLYFKFGANHDKYVAAIHKGQADVEDELFMQVGEKLPEDLFIEVIYKTKDGIQGVKNLTIKRGERDSEVFNLSPALFHRSDSDEIVFSGGESICEIFLKSGNRRCSTDVCVGNKHVYFSLEQSAEVRSFWISKGKIFPVIIYNGDNDHCILETHDDPITVSAITYYYEQCDYNEDAVWYDKVPDSAVCDDSKFILVHTGLTSATLNRTFDMNAFLWYTLNKEPSDIQAEYNKTMWDSRISAKKHNIERIDSGQWNEWYNSKADNSQELSCPSLQDFNGRLFPIIQCYRHQILNSVLCFEFPAQKFFKPNSKPTDSPSTYSMLRVNSTLYEYNWQYLNNIQIFKPKLILYGMFDALMKGLLSLKNGLSFNFKQQETRAKLSEAIKKYIEAVDTNVEDCYFGFSNDEFDRMLEETLLSRYNYVFNDGPTQTIHELSPEDYMNSIDNINLGASSEGAVTQIMKTITDVSLKSNETLQSVDYGIELGYDKNWWKNVVMSLATPIIESIFTPQVIVLIMINFDIMGITSKESLFSNKGNEVVNLIINKIFGLVKSIIRLIMDKFKELLLRLVFKYLPSMLSAYMLLIMLEKLEYWLKLLKDVATCVPMFNFSIRKAIGQIDNVNYADIITQQSLPEANTDC